MKHKRWLTALSFLMILILSGCFDLTQEVWHNKDGSGKVMIEMVLSQETLALMDIGGGSVQDPDEILKELEISPDELDTSDPNVRNTAVNSYYDAEAGNYHVVMEIELNDMMKGLPKDEIDDLSSFDFEIVENNNGSYRFSQTLDVSSGMGADELDQASIELMRPYMANNKYTVKLHVDNLIEADPIAIHDKTNNVVIWEIPMMDMMTAPDDIAIWAVYKNKSNSFLPSIDTGGLPTWVPYVIFGLCCLSLFVVVIVVVVIVLVARKRKKNLP